jgi:beta-propeller repeat-containing protein
MRLRASRLVRPASGPRRSVAMVATLTALIAITGFPGSLPAYGDEAAWTRQFGTNGLDEAKAIAADGEGATYVVGETFGTLPGQTPGGTLDAFVRKYDPAGQEMWTRQFGAWERDIAWGVAIDRLGSAYVVGQTEGTLPAQHSAGGWDAFIRKYDSSGTELWTRQFGGGGADIVSGVAVGPSGDLYVVGTTSSALPGQAQAGSFDAFVRHYDAAGQEVWTRQFGTSPGDNARRVAVDQDGQVMVVGSTEGALPGQFSAGGFDVFVSMFQADGRQLWTRQFGSTGDDFGVAIGTDRYGAISVAGSADRALPGGTAGTSFLRHFDVAGTVLWTDQFGTGQSDDAWDVAVDGDGVSYLVGTTEHVLPGQRSAGRLDAFVRKYSVDGKELWTRQYGTPEDDHALAGALTGRGIVLAGSTRGTLADRAAGELDAYVMHLTRPGGP